MIRAGETPDKVAVVVGGGSGHYPAFCGVVGPGFADGAVVGNVFTSPSTHEAYSVGRAAAHGAGLLFSTGNYAGDVMNFTLAQQRLQHARQAEVRLRIPERRRFAEHEHTDRPRRFPGRERQGLRRSCLLPAWRRMPPTRPSGAAC